MFFLHNLERVVSLHPSFFGKNMHEIVVQRLLADTEGTCQGDFYIISVMDAVDISPGKIVPGNAMAEFTVNYRAVVWRPFKGQTVDGIVDSVNQHGFFIAVGPLRVFITKQMCPPDVIYDANASPPVFTDKDTWLVDVGTLCRARIIGLRSEVDTMWAIGTVNEDFLG
ncbi:uncharacterized protein PgNI_08837 [Pyricularia grisea]|nr:uncharacterized protein PgNI_08837 [Pyricularia grisea]TLD06206.1 hypothetical protein PgNI_08837 [Pyricularia grisea]TLD29037.1 hypothetical protein PspLS_03810 [Pyricularia sp. CBS 133598]